MSKDLTAALRQLTGGQKTQALEPPQSRGSARRVVSAAPPPGGTSKSGGGAAIASPITEVSYASRQYYSQNKVITSPDGFAQIIIRPLRSVSFTDANNNPVEMIYQAPPQ